VSGHFSGIDIQTPPREASICPEQRAWIMLPVRCARLYARTSKHASIEIHAFGGHGASRTLACRARWERLRPRRNSRFPSHCASLVVGKSKCLIQASVPARFCMRKPHQIIFFANLGVFAYTFALKNLAKPSQFGHKPTNKPI
jgi:hypothetical protein